ncbi:MAG: HD domain-containing phosphohydrolase, partial [Candidatus Subteraquimicrobiales bacterium]|nr:HD domain-containing phosphohydrolase [Candidatus Subteraquimicrobiales bacterium]
QMFGADEGSIMLFDKDNLLHIKASHGLNEETVKKTKVKPGEGIAGWVALNKKPVLVTDITRDPRFQRLKPRAELCAALSVPLIVKERVAGVLNLSSICPAKFDHSDLRLLTTLASQIGVSIENAKLFKEMEEIYLDTVKAFIAAIEAKDPYTRGHSEQVAKYAVAIAKVMNLSEQEVEIIKSAALLHDIGKIGIHEDILNKPGSLTDEEYEMVKAHPFIAVQIISHIPRMKEVIPIIYHHHEHYNGNGYCCGLKGKGIPLGARILAVADAFDAMTSARPYRNAMGLSDVINELKRNANRQFDPQVVKIFCKAIEKHPELTQDILDLEELEVESSESQERTH